MSTTSSSRQASTHLALIRQQQHLSLPLTSLKRGTSASPGNPRPGMQWPHAIKKRSSCLTKHIAFSHCGSIHRVYIPFYLGKKGTAIPPVARQSDSFLKSNFACAEKDMALGITLFQTDTGNEEYCCTICALADPSSLQISSMNLSASHNTRL